jgi:hypothetical protein
MNFLGLGVAITVVAFSLAPEVACIQCCKLEKTARFRVSDAGLCLHLKGQGTF